MTSHSNAEQEDESSPPGIPPTDTESDAEAEEVSDIDEEELRKRWSTIYYHDLQKPMKEPLTAPWGLTVSDTDMEKLKVGFKSRSMDDKWDIKVEGPDEKGGILVHILRSWLQEDCYIFHIVEKISDDEQSGSATIQNITWEGDKAGLQCDAEQAQKEAVMVCRWTINCEFETLPHYQSSIMWQKSAYKRLHA